MPQWKSPSWTKEIINLIQLNDDSIQTGIDFNTINWSTIKKAGFKLREQIAGFDKEYGHLLWYPNINYNKPAMHMFMRLWGKVDITWHSAFITNNNISKTPFYEEKNVEYDHMGELINGVSKELGWSGILPISGFNFNIYLGQLATVFSEQFKIKTKVTTPLNLSDIGLEYIFVLNPDLIDEAKKIKFVRITIDTGEVDEHLRPIYENQDIPLNQLVDKSGDLPIMLKKISFVLVSGKEIAFFDFKDIFEQAHESFWKIKQVTLPNGQTTYALSIRSNFGALAVNQTFEIDPTWTSPSAIQSDCGATDIGNLIDGNLGTSGSHFINTHMHYVVFDMGQNYSISRVRCYTDDEVQSHRIYVSEDTSFTDAEIVSTDYCFPDMQNNWTEKAFTAKTGRYIKFELYGTGWCNLVFTYWFSMDFFEFEAYCEAVVEAPPRSYGYIF
jgi:hypothetical protein